MFTDEERNQINQRINDAMNRNDRDTSINIEFNIYELNMILDSLRGNLELIAKMNYLATNKIDYLVVIQKDYEKLERRIVGKIEAMINLARIKSERSERA